MNSLTHTSDPAICVWTCEAHGRTVTDAANEFCRTYWQEPRTLKRHLGPGFQFRLVDGVASYRVVSIPATADRPALYGVIRS